MTHPRPTLHECREWLAIRGWELRYGREWEARFKATNGGPEWAHELRCIHEILRRLRRPTKRKAGGERGAG